MSADDDEQSRALRLAKLLYLLMGLSYSIIYAFLPVMIRSYVSTARVGVILAVRNIVSTISGTAWGSYADFSHTHGMLFKISWLAGLLPAAGLFAEFALLSKSTTLLFWLLIATVGVYGLFNAPKEIFMTTATLDVLGVERKREWGKIRAWLSMGMGVGCVAFGQVLSSYGDLWCIGTYIVILVVSMPLAWIFGTEWALVKQATTRTNAANDDGEAESRDINSAAEGQQQQQQRRQSFCARFCHLVSDWHFLLLLVIGIVNGIGMATYDVYILLYMEDLKAPVSLERCC